jgi:hypothetical protein
MGFMENFVGKEYGGWIHKTHICVICSEKEGWQSESWMLASEKGKGEFHDALVLDL